MSVTGKDKRSISGGFGRIAGARLSNDRLWQGEGHRSTCFSDLARVTVACNKISEAFVAEWLRAWDTWP